MHRAFIIGVEPLGDVALANRSQGEQKEKPTTTSTKLLRSGPARLFNSLVLRFAGRRFFPLYGVIEHRGRRSGRIFHTPVVVRPLADGFVVPMPWGERTDWYRNVRAAGGCAIRWKGRYHPVARPETVDTHAVMSAFSNLERAIMSRLGITRCLRLRHQS